MDLKQRNRQAAMFQAMVLIRGIAEASLADIAELNTLRAGAYLTQAWTDGDIDTLEYEQLTRIASEQLRDWLPPRESNLHSGEPSAAN